jgi:threonine/homoserine/homoserine lactone efflux protein
MAAPLGPTGIMCIRRTLTDGRLHGLVIGLGAATADLLYGCVAAFGLTVIAKVNPRLCEGLPSLADSKIQSFYPRYTVFALFTFLR